MVATINIIGQFLEISDVGDVIVTDTQQSPDGDYVRDIRIFSRPLGAGTESGAALLVQLRVRAMTREMLDITAPPQNF